jgi:hypothetical protein
MRVLVTCCNKCLSPVKKKKNELQEQLYREPRHNQIQQLATDFRLTLSNAAEALVSLQAPAAVMAIMTLPFSSCCCDDYYLTSPFASEPCLCRS